LLTNISKNKNIYKLEKSKEYMKKRICLTTTFFLILMILNSNIFALTQITNCLELQDMSLNIFEDYELLNDINCSDTINWEHSKDEIGFVPISFFFGSLEGNNHTITDLYIKRDYPSMFKNFCRSASITNLRFNNATIIINAGGSGGLLVGEGGCSGATNIIIKNITAQGNVYGGQSEYAGGLFGRVNRAVTVVNAHYTGYVEGAGGLIGQNDGTVINSSYNGIMNGSLITIVAGPPKNNSQGLAGGFTGWNFGVIKTSFSEGEVYGMNNVGGFIGGDEYVDETWRGEVFDCYSHSDVYGDSYSGGFIGYNVGGNITDSYSTGSVSPSLTPAASQSESQGELISKVSLMRDPELESALLSEASVTSETDSLIGGFAAHLGQKLLG